MIQVKQDNLIANLRVVGELITNRVIALDTSYLKIVSVDGVQYLAGFGSQHDLILKVGEDRDIEDYSVNVEYAKLMALVGYMKEDIILDADNEGVLTKDGTVETYLNNIMTDNTDIDDIKDILEQAEESKDKEFKVNREEFHSTLRYLRGIQERDERTDIETGVMFTKDYSYVVSEVFAVRHNFGLEENIVLDSHATRVLIPYLANSEEEEVTIARKDGVTFFYEGDSVYRVDGLTDEVIEEYMEIFNHSGANDTISMEKQECLRVLNLTKVLTDSLEPDITFNIEDKKGRIYTETQDGDTVDSDFTAEECSDTKFTVSVDAMIQIISKLPQNVAQQLQLDVVIVPEERRYEEPALMHFKHELGDCVFSINTDIE